MHMIVKILAAVFLWEAVAYSSTGLDQAITEPIPVLQTQAAMGDPSSQFNLALAYQEGNGVERNIATAVQWYTKAANSGLAIAQFNLAVLYANGAEIPKNEKEAAKWFYAAAQNGYFDAQKVLIGLYLTGRGVPKSPTNALWWDFLARRTLALRYGGDGGQPPHPPTLHAGGGAEMLIDGKKVIVQDDGSIDRIANDGVTVRTLPDGRIQRILSDGTKTIEGKGRDNRGAFVRIVEKLGKDNQLIEKRVFWEDHTVVETPDGPDHLETPVKDAQGTALILIEELIDQRAKNGRLVRADNGAGPKEGEIWTIRRTLHIDEIALEDVIEKYSSTGRVAQQALPMTIRPDNRPTIVNLPGAIGTMPGEMATMPQQTATLPVGAGYRTVGENVYREKTDITPKLAALQELERSSRNFAGATEQDYANASKVSASFVIPLPSPPQKAGSSSSFIRSRIVDQTVLHDEPLLPIPDDRSKVVPFGLYGADVIKRYPWKHAETTHFIVHYLDSSEAALTMQYIEGAYFMITNLLNLAPERGSTKSHVFLFRDREEWNAYLSSTGKPPQVAGFAYKTELLLGSAPNKAALEASMKTLCHEVTHAVIARFYPGRAIPLWLNEGLAEYNAARTVSVKRGQPAGKFLSHDAEATIDLSKLFDRIKYGNISGPVAYGQPDPVRVFYADAEKCVRVICEKLPADGFPKLFNALAAGNAAGPSLVHAYGSDVAAVQALVNNNQ